MYPGIPYKMIGIAEGGIYEKPMAIATVLGSCVAVTFYCPRERIGATFHAILHKWKVYEKSTANINPYRYVDSAINHIVMYLLKKGIRREQIISKVFGGADAVSQGKAIPGQLNIQAAIETLAENKIKVINSDVGGRKGREFIFITGVGDVYIKKQ